MNGLGKDFTGQTQTLLATLVLTLVYASTNVAWQIMIVLGRMWTALLLVVLHSLIYMIVFIVFKSQGAYGLAIARLISYGIYAAVNMLYVEVKLAIKIDCLEKNNVS